MKKNLSILLGLLLAVNFSCFAQDYDDIYYNSSKKKTNKTNVVVEKNENSAKNESYKLVAEERDVDEYNRRYSVQDTIDLSSEKQGDFVYTDRIKRFHNPSVIIETNDPEVAEVYYVSTTPSVNLIIGTPTYSWNPYWYDWYYPSYSWHMGWYRPSWCHWDWHWTFGWGWDWCHSLYHHHHHHYYPSWGPIVPNHPGHGVIPPAGGHRPTYNAGGRRPNVSQGSKGTGVGRRPNVTAVDRNNTTVNKGGNRRPSVNSERNSNNKSTGRRPSVNNNTSENKKQSRDSYNSNRSSQSSRNSGFSSGSSLNRNSFGGSNSGSGSSRGGNRGGRR